MAGGTCEEHSSEVSGRVDPPHDLVGCARDVDECDDVEFLLRRQGSFCGEARESDGEQAEHHLLACHDEDPVGDPVLTDHVPLSEADSGVDEDDQQHQQKQFSSSHV